MWTILGYELPMLSDTVSGYNIGSYICEMTNPPTTAGPRLNIKTVLSTYGDFHVKDKTAIRTSYL